MEKNAREKEKRVLTSFRVCYYFVMATLNQERVFKKVQEQVRNGKKVSISRAMRESGVYSPHVSKMPEKLTESKGWKELMQQHFPDEKLAALHKRILRKEETVVVSDGSQTGSHIEWTKQPHGDALKALEMTYRLKGKFPKDEDGGNKTLVVIVAGQSANRYDVSTSESGVSTS